MLDKITAWTTRVKYSSKYYGSGLNDFTDYQISWHCVLQKNRVKIIIDPFIQFPNSE